MHHLHGRPRCRGARPKAAESPASSGEIRPTCAVWMQLGSLDASWVTGNQQVFQQVFQLDGADELHSVLQAARTSESCRAEAERAVRPKARLTHASRRRGRWRPGGTSDGTAAGMPPRCSLFAHQLTLNPDPDAHPNQVFAPPSSITLAPLSNPKPKPNQAFAPPSSRRRCSHRGASNLIRST